MKRLLITIALLLPIALINAQVVAQTYSLDAERLAQQIDQEARGELSKEKEEKILKTLSPEMKTKLEEIKKLNKEKYQQLLLSHYGVNAWSTGFAKAESVFGLNGISEAYRKENELEIDVELLALKCKQAGDNEKQKIKNELNAKLSDLFEIKEAKKQEEIKRLEKRLQELKESLQERKQNKNEIVNRRMQELLGNPKYLYWE